VETDPPNLVIQHQSAHRRHLFIFGAIKREKIIISFSSKNQNFEIKIKMISNHLLFQRNKTSKKIKNDFKPSVVSKK